MLLRKVRTDATKPENRGRPASSGWVKAVFSAVCVFVALVIVPVAGNAQPDEGLNLGKVLKRAPTGEKKTQAIKAEMPVDTVQLAVTWGNRQVAEGEEQDRLTDKYIGESRSRGIPNQPALSMGLINEGLAAAGNGDPKALSTRIGQARSLSPDLPYFAAIDAYNTFQRSPGSVIRLVGQINRSYRGMWRWLPARYEIMTSVAHTGATFLGLIALILGLVVTVRHLRLVAADARRVLPSGISTNQLMLACILVIITPGLLLGSPLASVLVAVVLCAAHLSWIERVLAAVALGGLLVSPLAAHHAQAAYDFAGSDASNIWALTVKGCDDACLETPPALKDNADQRLVIARDFVVATGALRTGKNIDQSVEDFEDLAVKARGSSNEVIAAIENNRGVALSQSGKQGPAIAAFNKAKALVPSEWRVHHNVHRALDAHGKPTDAEASVRTAMSLGGDDASAASEETSKVINLRFQIFDHPIEPIAKAHFAMTPNGDLPFGLWEAWSGPLFRDATLYTGGGGLAGLVLFWILGLVLRRSRRCPRCGLEMVAGDDGPRGIVSTTCRACGDFFLGGKMKYQEKVTHEAQLNRWDSMASWSFRLGNVLVPGLGSALRGSAFGLIATTFAFAGIALLLSGRGALPDSWLVTNAWIDDRFALGVMLMSVGVVMSLVLLAFGDSKKPGATMSKAPKGKRKTAQAQFEGAEGDASEGDAA